MKTKRRHNKQRKLIGILVGIAIVSIAIFVFYTHTLQVDPLDVTYLEQADSKTIQKNAQESFSQTYAIQGYTIYGESLKLYKSASTKSNDDLHGKNVILRNLETQKEYSYTFSSGAEEGIHLGNIPEGIYEVFVYDHYQKKRVYSKSEIHASTFTTMRRNKSVKNVSLDADHTYLMDFDVELNKDYVFVTVTDSIPFVNKIDVMIDPADGVSLEFANLVKENLEQKGLRVEFTREEDQNPSYYGKKGRVGKGYAKEAKVFLTLGPIDNYYVEHPLIYTSPYTGAGLANSISLSLQDQGVEPYDNREERSLLEQGVVYDSYISLDDMSDSKFEFYSALRESGGKLTYTGQMDDADANRSFKNNYGMYGVYVQYYNPDNSDSKAYYKKNKEAMAQGISDGIVQYFEIEGEVE